MSDYDSEPVPNNSLELLRNTAFGDTGGSQAARYFLFWLAGEQDPTGFNGDGAAEIRRLDPKHTEAAQKVFTWWIGRTYSDDPLHDILNQLRERFQEPTDA